MSRYLAFLFVWMLSQQLSAQSPRLPGGLLLHFDAAQIQIPSETNIDAWQPAVSHPVASGDRWTARQPIDLFKELATLGVEFSDRGTPDANAPRQLASVGNKLTHGQLRMSVGLLLQCSVLCDSHS